MDLLHYVVDLKLEVAHLDLKVPDLRSGEIRLTLTPAFRNMKLCERPRKRRVDNVREEMDTRNRTAGGSVQCS